jgi:protein TonB
MAEQAGVEGRVVIEFEVGTDGVARDFVVIESLPAGCDDAAIEAIKRMEFTAATQGGKSVPTRIKMPFMFKKG